jgi:hypothetical protein
VVLQKEKNAFSIAKDRISCASPALMHAFRIIHFAKVLEFLGEPVKFRVMWISDFRLEVQHKK